MGRGSKITLCKPFHFYGMVEAQRGQESCPGLCRELEPRASASFSVPCPASVPSACTQNMIRLNGRNLR